MINRALCRPKGEGEFADDERIGRTVAREEGREVESGESEGSVNRQLKGIGEEHLFESDPGL